MMHPLARLTILGVALNLTAGLAAAPFGKGGILGVGARPMGMGGAFVAIADDASSVWWNPAGLIKRKDFEVAGHYGQLLGGRSTDTSVVHRGWLEEVDLGYGLAYRGVNSGGPFILSETTVLASVGLPFTDDRRLLFGATAKFYSTSLDFASVRARGTGFDLGFLYTPPVADDRLSLGLAVLDFQTGLTWTTGFFSMPPTLIEAGAAWHFDPNTVAAIDLELIHDSRSKARSSVGYKLGIERWIDLPYWNLQDVLALRVGWFDSDAVAGLFTVGLGLQYGEFLFDYAFVQSPSGLGSNHRLSGTYRFGLPPLSKSQERPRAKPEALKKIEFGLRAEPEAFTPGATEGPGSTHIALLLDRDIEIMSWGAVISNAEGVAVLELKRNAKQPPAAIKWKGLRKGKSLPPGAYQVFVSLYGKKNRVLAASQIQVRLTAKDKGSSRLELNRRYSIFAPGNSSLRSEAFFSPILNGNSPVSWQLSIVRKNGGAVRVIKGGKKLPKDIVWNGKDSQGKWVPDGDYEANLVVSLGDGRKLTAASEVVVDTRRPRLKIESGLEVFTPNAGEQGALGIFPLLVEAGGLPARWTIEVRNNQGEKIKSFKGKGLPPAQLSWNGNKSSGKPAAYGSMFELRYQVVTEAGARAQALPVVVASSVRPFTEANAIQVTLATILFEPGDASLDLDQYAHLKKAAAAIKKYGTEFLVQLKGHTDEEESRGRAALELSRKRAQAVFDYITRSEGLPASRVAAAGYGNAQALEGDGSLEHQAKNRRVEIILFTK